MGSAVLPRAGAAQPLNLFLPRSPWEGALWLAAFNSFALDYIARQTIGGIHLNITTCRQLPIPFGVESWSPEIAETIKLIVCELVVTSPEVTPFSESLGVDPVWFPWNEERRLLLRCELDAAFFHVYGIARDDVDYIMDTFPIVKREDEKAHGEYRRKRVILEVYDEMARSATTGRPYCTRLDPPPADPRMAYREGGRSG